VVELLTPLKPPLKPWALTWLHSSPFSPLLLVPQQSHE
jgi:hypothetical protein